MPEVAAKIQERNQVSERILVVGPAWVGDMLLSQSLYKSLWSRFPQVPIDVIAPAWSKALLHRMPEVNDAIELPISHGELKINVRYRYGRDLRRRQYSHAIVLPRSFKSALLPWFANIPQRTGYRGEIRYGLINDMRPLDKRVLPRTIDRQVFLGHPPGTKPGTYKIDMPCLQVDHGNALRCLERLQLNMQRQVLALLPGAAYGRSKRWPPKYFSEVADYYAQKGFQIWIFGSPNEAVLAEEIMSAAKCLIADLCGKLSLEEVIDVLSLVSLAISNDSGLMHVAAAVGCPLVVVYGSSSPEYTPPMTSRAQILRQKNLSCSPCYKPTCRYGHYNCLTRITPTEACRAGERVFSQD